MKLGKIELNKEQRKDLNKSLVEKSEHAMLNGLIYIARCQDIEDIDVTKAMVLKSLYIEAIEKLAQKYELDDIGLVE